MILTEPAPLLAGLAANPNAAGVLLLGLGCELNQLDALLEAVPEAARRQGAGAVEPERGRRAGRGGGADR